MALDGVRFRVLSAIDPYPLPPLRAKPIQTWIDADCASQVLFIVLNLN